MTVSAVIPSAGTRGLLRKALDAVVFAAEAVVVVTDNKMTDDGWRAIDEHGAEVVHVPGPFNFSRAINAGVEHASGDELLLLNDDIRLPSDGKPDWVDKLAGKPGDVRGVLLLATDEWTVEHGGIWFRAPGGMPCHIYQGDSISRMRMRDVDVLGVTGACMMVRRKAWKRIGGFDEAFPVNYGDVSFCLRAVEMGLRITQNNTISLIHAESSTRGRENFPTPDDYVLLADRHGAFLRRRGIVMDPFGAARHLEERLSKSS